MCEKALKDDAVKSIEGVAAKLEQAAPPPRNRDFTRPHVRKVRPGIAPSVSFPA